MGTGASKLNQVRPGTGAAHISVQPAPSNQLQALTRLNSSGNSAIFPPLDLSLNSRGASAGNSSDDTLKKSSSSRPSSSRRNSLSHGGSEPRRHVGSAKRFTRHGSASRPISSLSRKHSAKRFGHFGAGGGDRLMSPGAGLPLQRDMDILADFNESYRAGQKVGVMIQDEFSEVIFLRTDPNQLQEKPVSHCQLCGNQFTNLGIRVPLLLLCGHTYCSNCLEKACESYVYPTALRCGICMVITPLDQQTPSSLPQNEAVLELIGSKEYSAMSDERNLEMCAECERKPAVMYCSECSASYCDYCGKKAHEGSKVRAKHKPVSINLKPRPQPTCKKHPGQSCVLYCETEKQPMCVLCKFYNQHRFHKFDLMSKVASKYCMSVTEKLGELDKMEKELDAASQALYNSVEEINSCARKAQERLERHFADMKKSYLAALERREATLLALVDKQVEVKQEMLGEARMEIAAARARVLAAREEAVKLLQLNPITTLLSRRHMDISFERTLKQSVYSPHLSIPPDVPLSLLPDIMPSVAQTLGQHGAILQLPPKPYLNQEAIHVTANAISVDWMVKSPDSDVIQDRTLTYSLHCYADVPFKLKGKLNFKRRLAGNMATPESGFEEMSDLSSESKNTFPSVPPSLLGSRNISLVTQQHDQNVTDSKETNDQSIKEEQNGVSVSDNPNGLILKPTIATKNITSLLPEPIRLPKPADPNTESKLPQLLVHPVNNPPNPKPRPPTNQAPTGAILNLPPLKPQGGGAVKQSESDTELVSVTTSGVFADSEDEVATPNERRMTTVGEDNVSDNPQISKTESSSSFSDMSDDLHSTSDCSNLGRFCYGYAFEEIYCGETASFHYTGLVAGASYYFRVRGHNAAGWGPWSDTIKCKTSLGHT